MISNWNNEGASGSMLSVASLTQFNTVTANSACDKTEHRSIQSKVMLVIEIHPAKYYGTLPFYPYTSISATQNCSLLVAFGLPILRNLL